MKARKHDPVAGSGRVAIMTKEKSTNAASANDSTAPRASAPLVFDGTTIRTSGKYINLTDMWKAAGADHNQRVHDWLRLPATVQFMDHLLSQPDVLDDIKNMQESPKRENPASGNFVKNGGLTVPVKGGTDRGSTLAHWHLAFAYAKYLSPAFHVWCNEVVRAVMEGRAAPTAGAMSQEDATRLLAHLHALEAKVDRLLLERMEPGLIGKNRAEQWVKKPIRNLGRLHYRITGDDYTSVRAMIETDIRFAVSFFGAWETLPENMVSAVRRQIYLEQKKRLRPSKKRAGVRGPGLAKTAPGQLDLPNVVPMRKAKAK